MLFLKKHIYSVYTTSSYFQYLLSLDLIRNHLHGKANIKSSMDKSFYFYRYQLLPSNNKYCYLGTCEPSLRLAKCRRASSDGPPPNSTVVIPLA